MQTTQNISSARSIRKTDPEDYDLVILGGGTGSTLAAWTFASEGRRVAVIDRKYIGGSCPNIACLPSKNVIHSAKVASYFCRSKEFGIAHDGFTVDMLGVRERKRKMVSGLNAMYLEEYRNTGAEFILGAGRFIAPRTVEVYFPDGTTRRLRGTNVIVSTVRDPPWRQFLDSRRHNRSRILRHSNLTAFPNIYSSLGAAMSEWSCRRRCAGSGAK